MIECVGAPISLRASKSEKVRVFFARFCAINISSRNLLIVIEIYLSCTYVALERTEVHERKLEKINFVSRTARVHTRDFLYTVDTYDSYKQFYTSFISTSKRRQRALHSGEASEKFSKGKGSYTSRDSSCGKSSATLINDFIPL